MSRNEYILLSFGFVLGALVSGLFIFLIQQTNNKNNVQESVNEVVCKDMEIVENVIDTDEVTVAKSYDNNYEWKQYTNKNRDYTISYPVDFSAQDEMPNHIDISSPQYDGKNQNGLRIQIQKHILSDKIKSTNEYKRYLMKSRDNSVDNIQYDDFVNTPSQYVTNTSKKSFVTYIVFDEKNDKYYTILVFEPGYSNNKELIETIIKTFIIL